MKRLDIKEVGRFILLIFMICFIAASEVRSEYLNRNNIFCGDSLSEHRELEIEGYNDTLLNEKLLKHEADSIVIGKTKFNIVDYIFRKDRFVGISIPVFKKQIIDQVLRDLDSKYTLIERRHKNRELIWITKSDEYLILKRFTIHLGEIKIICKYVYEEERKREGQMLIRP